MLADFESNLIGTSAGKGKRFTIDFPNDYPDSKLRAQKVDFDVSVHEVAELQPAALDEQFVTFYGVVSGDFTEFRQLVKSNLQREVASRIQAELRRQVLEQLIAANPVELPSVLVSREAAGLQAEGMRNLGINDVKDAPPLEAYTEIAERRVRLGLIVAAVIREQGLKVDQERVRQKLDDICKPSARPEEMRRLYLQSPELMAQIENVVIEDQVLSWLTDRAQIHGKASSVAALTGRP
jgi:trigger factor